MRAAPDRPGEGGRTLIPGLARELPSVGKDGRSFTFALKAHVHFANGAVVTPDDVKATFERLMDPRLLAGRRALRRPQGSRSVPRGTRHGHLRHHDLGGRCDVPPQHERPLAARARRIGLRLPAARGHAASPYRRARLAR